MKVTGNCCKLPFRTSIGMLWVQPYYRIFNRENLTITTSLTETSTPERRSWYNHRSCLLEIVDTIFGSFYIQHTKHTTTYTYWYVYMIVNALKVVILFKFCKIFRWRFYFRNHWTSSLAKKKKMVLRDGQFSNCVL